MQVTDENKQILQNITDAIKENFSKEKYDFSKEVDVDRYIEDLRILYEDICSNTPVSIELIPFITGGLDYEISVKVIGDIKFDDFENVLR